MSNAQLVYLFLKCSVKVAYALVQAAVGIFNRTLCLQAADI